MNDSSIHIRYVHHRLLPTKKSTTLKVIVIMDYLTSAETAEKWGISDRRVTKLCNEGRVDGAIRKGFMWLIPAETEKPTELKRGVKPTK